MAEAVEYGLMLWDGKSYGTTINNVVNLSRDRKPVVLYIAPKNQFITVKALETVPRVFHLRVEQRNHLYLRGLTLVFEACSTNFAQKIFL